MQRDFSALKDRHFDVLVCGGGIYGAWTAYDAALRGLKVAVVDQGDWACATSSASSKLVHGGLRYLETLDFKLVRKTLSERQMLLQTAPHRIWPLRFGIPVYQHSRLGSFRLKVGLMLYDLLAANVPKSQQHQYHAGNDFAERFPVLDTAGLTGGFTYLDAQTDDARLVLELISGAQSAGAICLNYCQVTGFLQNHNQLCGAICQDKVTGETGKVFARQIVNCAGQWSTTLEAGNTYRLSKGVHLILPGTGLTEALLLTAHSDGRVFFLIPWYGMTLLGTTDTDYHGNIDQVTVEAEDIDYLLTEANHFLKTTNWTKQDLIGRYAGLRVLKQSHQDSPSTVSRDWELSTSANGLLSSIGGKLTSAREDAEVIVDTVCKNLGITAPCVTFGKALPWLPADRYDEYLASVLIQANRLGIDTESAHWLLRRHGHRVSGIFQLIEQTPDLANRITSALPFISADLIFCAQHEMVVHLEDLLRRRMPLLILSKMTRGELQRLAQLTAKLLNWDKASLDKEIDYCWQKYLHTNS